MVAARLPLLPLLPLLLVAKNSTKIKKAPNGAFLIFQPEYLVIAIFLSLYALKIFLFPNLYSHFIIFIPLLLGAYCKIPKRQQIQISEISIKYKSYGFVIFCTLLLGASFLINKIFSNISIDIFNFDYIFIFLFLFIFSKKIVSAIEARSPNEQDDYYLLGKSLLNNEFKFKDHLPLLRSWVVRIFFLPLIYTWTFFGISALTNHQWTWNPNSIVIGIFNIGLCIDLLMALCGYIFSSRIFCNKVISTDSTWSGWFVCLICYPPLFFILHALKQQTDQLIWSDWLSLNDGWLYWMWCAIICGTWCVYFLASVNMGFKFSNLSWRGLVSHGMYRYVKHPAYLSKNIYWWAHTVPFVGVASSLDLLRNVAGLTFVSLIYYLRAKTEERHLMQFAEYRAYSAHMAEHGLWPRLRRKLWPRPHA